MRMPYHAVTRCGELCGHCAKARVLWQYEQFTPSELDMWFMRPYVHSAALVVWVLPVGRAVVPWTRIFSAPNKNGVNGSLGNEAIATE